VRHTVPDGGKFRPSAGTLPAAKVLLKKYPRKNIGLVHCCWIKYSALSLKDFFFGTKSVSSVMGGRRAVWKGPFCLVQPGMEMVRRNGGEVKEQSREGRRLADDDDDTLMLQSFTRSCCHP